MIIFLSVFIGVLLADQGMKAALADHVIQNSGVAFGWFSDVEWVVPLLISMGIALWWKTRPTDELSLSSRIGEALLVGGALSNCIDRIVFGGIRDPLSFGLISLRFNLADIAILTGLFLLFFYRGRR